MGDATVIRVAIVGLGKMGLSHLAMFNAHPEVQVVAVCDSSGYVLSVLSKYTGLKTYTDFDELIDRVPLDAIVIATPSRTHAAMVRKAVDRGVHVFCEKPFTLHPSDSTELTTLSTSAQVVTQVGYHNRFVAAFAEVKALLDAGALGTVTHALAEAYGPVVLRSKGGTWRSNRDEGGGCLHDYAAHAIDLLTWYLGEATGVGGTTLGSVFSRDTDDVVHSTIHFADGKTAQLSANWSDESFRKMTTRVTIWGTTGRIFVDRQECQVYLRDTAKVPDGYETGWNVRYTTDLTEPVWFYLRGEEYSAQIDYFVQSVKSRRVDGLNRFESAAATDRVIAMMIGDAAKGASTGITGVAHRPAPRRRRFFFRRAS